MSYSITKEIHNELELKRQEYLKDWLKKYHTDYLEYCMDGEHYLPIPTVYMLGGLDHSIFEMVKIGAPTMRCEGTCGLMPKIDSKEFCKALIKLKYGFLGIARVGAFHTNNLTTRGVGITDLWNKNPNAIFLSLGRNGMFLEKANKFHDEQKELNLNIVGK